MQEAASVCKGGANKGMKSLVLKQSGGVGLAEQRPQLLVGEGMLPVVSGV